MNPCIVTFFMENVDMKTVGLQRSVIDKFNKSRVPLYCIKVDVPHAVAIDYFWTLNGCKMELFKDHDIQKQIDHDVVLFLDIDCIPLSEESIDLYIEKASQGIIAGNAQRTNHLINGQHVFAAPSAVAISKEVFEKIGCPSACETQRSDVAEEWTWLAEDKGIKVETYLPIKFDAPPIRYEWEKNQPPYWALKDGMPNYGIGTTFGDSNKELWYHNFQIFHPGQQERFWNKCESILTGV